MLGQSTRSVSVFVFLVVTDRARKLTLLASKDYQSSCFKSDVTSRHCTIAYIHACCYSSFAEGSYASAAGPGRMQSVSEQHLSSGPETRPRDTGEGRRCSRVARLAGEHSHGQRRVSYCCRSSEQVRVLNTHLDGSFQMVSLLKLAEVTEEGVRFLSPHDGTPM